MQAWDSSSARCYPSGKKARNAAQGQRDHLVVEPRQVEEVLRQAIKPAQWQHHWRRCPWERTAAALHLFVGNQTVFLNVTNVIGQGKI